MKHYDVLLFDADNTLLDFDECERVALHKTFEAHACLLDDAMKVRYMEINHALWKEYEEGRISREEVIFTRFGKLFAEFAIDLDGVEFEHYYQNELSKSHELMPHAMELVQELKQTHALYIVSNGVTATQYARLRDSGLDRYMTDIFVSEEVGCRKPMPEYFAYCFAHIQGLHKQKALIIGDSLSSDIQGGINAGIDTCWYNPKKQPNTKGLPITYEIDDLRQLLQIV